MNVKNKEFAETLTGEGGLLQGGALPGIAAASDKSLLEAVTSETTVAVKKLKKPKETTEPAEPQTILEPAPEERSITSSISFR